MSQPIVVFDDHEECEKARGRLGEALVRVTEERDEARAQVHQLHKRGIDHVRRHHRLFDEWMTERAQLVDDRDEARDEVVKLGRRSSAMEQQLETLRSEREQLWRMLDGERAELVRLRTIIVELGAGEAAEPEEQIEALRPGGVETPTTACVPHGDHPHRHPHGGEPCDECPQCFGGAP